LDGGLRRGFLGEGYWELKKVGTGNTGQKKWE
jgi:hypothetical protein